MSSYVRHCHIFRHVFHFFSSCLHAQTNLITNQLHQQPACSCNTLDQTCASLNHLWLHFHMFKSYPFLVVQLQWYLLIRFSLILPAGCHFFFIWIPRIVYLFLPSHLTSFSLILLNMCTHMHTHTLSKTKSLREKSISESDFLSSFHITKIRT